MPMFSDTFRALLVEAQFTQEVLDYGVTQIGDASFATKGVYFQAFSSLSIGLERIGKLCLMLDYYIGSEGRFPDPEYLRKEIGHNILLIYNKSKSLIDRRSISLRFLKNLDEPIHQNILTILSGFANGDRYSNINLLTGNTRKSDPIATWHEKVDRMIFKSHISAARKTEIARNARTMGHAADTSTSVMYISETGGEITSLQEANYQTGVQEAVAPYRILFVVQIIRFWVELLLDFQYKAMEIGVQDIPHFSEVFALFYNEDSYFMSGRAKFGRSRGR